MRVAIVALSGMNLHLDGSSYLGVFVMPQTPTPQAECAGPRPDAGTRVLLF